MRKVEVERLYCDCCGKEVNSFQSTFILPNIVSGDREYEMCKKCSNKFNKFLKVFIKVKDENGEENKKDGR